MAAQAPSRGTQLSSWPNGMVFGMFGSNIPKEKYGEWSREGRRGK
jgi:hypothetical protein